MSQAPSMPVFVDAMLADTLHLSRDEFGAYHFILYATWRNNGNPLKDDDDLLARVCRATPAAWRKLRPILVAFFDVSDGYWRQKRLEKEWSYVADRAQRAKENGTKGGRPKKTDSEPRRNPSGSFWVPQTESTHIHTQQNKEEQPSVSKDTGAEAVADPVSIYFTTGRALMSELGVSAKQQGSLLGKLRQSTGDNIDRAQAVIDQMAEVRPADPVSWLMARTRKPSEPEFTLKRASGDPRKTCVDQNGILRWR